MPAVCFHSKIHFGWDDLHMFRSNAVLWGDVATWFSGISTMLAVVIGAVFYITGEWAAAERAPSHAELVSG